MWLLFIVVALAVATGVLYYWQSCPSTTEQYTSAIISDRTVTPVMDTTACGTGACVDGNATPEGPIDYSVGDGYRYPETADVRVPGFQVPCTVGETIDELFPNKYRGYRYRSRTNGQLGENFFSGYPDYPHAI